MYCPHCGATLEPGMRFCPGCGAPRGSSPRPAWEDPGEEDEAGSGPGLVGNWSRDREEEPSRQVVIIREEHHHHHAGDGRRGLQLADPGKSYTVWAWVCLALYFAFYVPGLIANVLFWRSSVKYQRETGVRASGSGCLVWLLWVIGIGFPLMLVLGSGL
ncbi:MAG: zinc ribbon domain-containing protein [Chloroflexota bacterium]